MIPSPPSLVALEDGATRGDVPSATRVRETLSWFTTKPKYKRGQPLKPSIASSCLSSSWQRLTRQQNTTKTMSPSHLSLTQTQKRRRPLLSCGSLILLNRSDQLNWALSTTIDRRLSVGERQKRRQPTSFVQPFGFD